MAQFIVEIQGRGPYTVEAPSLEVLTQATERWSEWLRSGGGQPPSPGVPISTPGGTQEPGWTGLGTAPRVPNEGVTPEQEQRDREIQQFGQYLSEAVRAARPMDEQIGDWTRNVGNALTFGNFNELVAGADNLLGNRDGMSFEARLAYEDQQDALHRQANPLVSTAVDLGGNLATGMAAFRAGASPMSRAQPTMASVLPRAAAEGAGYGALAGFGTGEGFNPIERLRNAGAGALVGGTAGGVMGGVGGTIANRSMLARAPTREAVAAGTNAAADTMRNAGVRFNVNGFDNLIQRIDADLQGQNIGAMNGSAAERWRNNLLQRSGQAPTLEEVDLIRRDIQQAARDARGGANPNLNDARLLDRIVTAFDDYIQDPQAPILSGNLPQAQAANVEMRRLSLAGKKADAINQAIAEAARSAGARTATPASTQSALANAFRSLANDADAIRMFTTEERQLIDEIAGGAWTENRLRALGRLAPGNLLSMGGFPVAAAGIGGGYMAGGVPGAAAAGLAGEIGGRASAAMTNQNVGRLGAMALSSGRAAPAGGILPSVSGMNALVPSQAIQLPTTQGLLNTYLPARRGGVLGY